MWVMNNIVQIIMAYEYYMIIITTMVLRIKSEDGKNF